MKKIKILLSFLMLSVLAFAELNDNLKLFDEGQRKTIEKKIEDIKTERDLKVFVNTFNEDIGFVTSKSERAVILNLKKIGEENYKVEISLSKDIDIEEQTTDIEEILSESAKLLEEKKYSEYIITILDGMDAVLEEIKIVPLNEMTMTKGKDNTDKKYYEFLLVVLVIILCLILFLYKNKEKLKSRLSKNTIKNKVQKEYNVEELKDRILKMKSKDENK